MKLTADQFKQIITSLRSDISPHKRSSERRDGPRVGFRMTVTVVPCTVGDAPVRLEVRVRDLSTEGVGILHHSPMEPQSRFVALMSRANGTPVRALYRVARCEKVAHRQFLIGGILERVLDAGEAAA